ncbi:uncharacterized protein CTHT_0008890 [Thermochaetoides thermophila DSM 1495]|uniref:TATA element modulatory factor 1 TATA binding domain-containing protein n=1 Tax=Chaetomium thermophilum (strain DSM 1495 / CBS 144.50 / IMI 039719) TaxID=759272 RepID=G0S064_CHATD|nr:hypothetical protein CTHT_0008890 [Thermochaetoides thermophila DSM 1495]EGS23225.1 hypothetical protein CTHT_0008890 [Thermochaetoides thermophila DSM 1495]
MATSRWGALLSQAVAGVEAKLDTLLADSDSSSSQQNESKPPTPSPAKQTPAAPRTSTSSSRANDRLQEKLARAMAAKGVGRGSLSAQASPRQSIDAPRRDSTDSIDRTGTLAKDLSKDTQSPRCSLDVTTKSSEDSAPSLEKALSEVRGKDFSSLPQEANGASSSTDAQPDAITSPPDTVPAAVASEPVPKPDIQSPPDSSTDEDLLKEDRQGSDESQRRHQEEIHSYVERIDALEAKLQFLAREATESARKAALAAPPGSLEKKLAEKDQQIAQLMEEGKNLASTEQNLRAALKKLRATVADNEKELNNLRTAKDKSEKEIEALRGRARRADELEKAQDDLQKRLEQAQKELNSLRPEIRSKDNLIAELRTQLQKATEQAEAISAKVNEQEREKDKRRIADLEEEVAALKVEKNLVADRAKAQAAELREKAERANERARALELELKAEVQLMEGKLEAMRIRAEEVSSSAAGDSQAKLLRQIETLQTQYSIASENWQGIETTLLARIAGLEKERDEAVQRESEMRKKAREAALRAKRQEEELEETRAKLPNIQEEVKSYQVQVSALKKRAEEAEAALAKATAEFEKQKQAWEVEREEQRQLQSSERPRSWLEELPSASFLKQAESRPDSPQLTVPQRAFSTDFLGIQNFSSSKLRKASAPPSEAGGMPFSLSSSRRPSAQPPGRPSITPQLGAGSSGVFSPVSLFFSPTSEAAPPNPLATAAAPTRGGADEAASSIFEGIERTTSPPPHNPTQTSTVTGTATTTGAGAGPATSAGTPQQTLQDMVSVSTVAAGPSVQLVERMSAAIRRLESEKIAAREELARISRQRDEARAEIVTLMREIEQGRAAAQRTAELEKELKDVRQRYETTLELLGEKSEEVEELKQDVADLKSMMRELVERTVK